MASSTTGIVCVPTVNPKSSAVTPSGTSTLEVSSSTLPLSTTPVTSPSSDPPAKATASIFLLGSSISIFGGWTNFEFAILFQSVSLKELFISSSSCSFD